MEPLWRHLFLAWLALTLAVELPLLLVVTRGLFRLPAAGAPTGRLLGGGLLATGLTYPYLWFVVPGFFSDFATGQAVGEVLVVAVETLVYRGTLAWPWPRALTASALCNAGSLLLGLALNAAVRSHGWFT